MEFSRYGSIFDLKVGTDSNGCYSRWSFADVAQLVEHHLAKVRVASSNLVVRSQLSARTRNCGFGLNAFCDTASGGSGLSAWLPEDRSDLRLHKHRACGPKIAR